MTAGGAQRAAACLNLIWVRHICRGSCKIAHSLNSSAAHVSGATRAERAAVYTAMAIIALGINHKTAAVELRGRVAFAPEKVEAELHSARQALDLNEAALLSTCNRTELYLHGDAGDEEILAWLAESRGVALSDLSDCYYSYRDQQAVEHLMSVASGLDSLVLGEPQILGQIKSAYAVGCQAGTLASELHSAFQLAFSTAKTVRSQTAIGQNPVSVAYAAVALAQQIFTDMGSARALLIGAGETIELVARHLAERGVGNITVANRTLQRATELAGKFNAEAVLLADIPEQLAQADIVISSTASQLPILGKGAVESALKKRRRRPIFMLDIAVPRDIEEQVGELDDVYLYTVDDLEEVIEDNLRARHDAAEAAREIVATESERWFRQRRSLAAVDTIKAYRTAVDSLRSEELKRALAALQRGTPAEEVVDTLARSLANKMMHAPTIALRQASEAGREDILELAQQLFDLHAE